MAPQPQAFGFNHRHGIRRKKGPHSQPSYTPPVTLVGSPPGRFPLCSAHSYWIVYTAFTGVGCVTVRVMLPRRSGPSVSAGSGADCSIVNVLSERRTVRVQPWPDRKSVV